MIGPFGGAKLGFFAENSSEKIDLMTVWRRMQSLANFSLPKFPANREKYRDFELSLVPFYR